MLVAVAWVDIPETEQARELKQFVDRHGTGNVLELSQERGRHQNIRFTGEYYPSVREDTTVVNAQAQPLSRTQAARALAERVADAALTS